MRMTRDVAAFVRAMLGAVLALVLLAWMAVACLVGVAVMLTVKGVVSLAYVIRRFLVALRIMKPTTARRCSRAAEAVIDV